MTLANKTPLINKAKANDDKLSRALITREVAFYRWDIFDFFSKVANFWLRSWRADQLSFFGANCQAQLISNYTILINKTNAVFSFKASCIDEPNNLLIVNLKKH